MAGAGQCAEPESGFLAFSVQADQFQFGSDLHLICGVFESFKIAAGAEFNGSAWMLLHEPENGR